MRDDNLQFKRANESPAKSPRFVVAILFDVGSIYVTSHSDIANVPGIVLAGALQKPSAISQRIVPDEGRSEIGTFSFDIVDTGSDFTDELRSKLAAGKGLRGKTVRLWCGFRGFDFSAFQLFQTQVVTECEYNDGVYTVGCHDITRQQRTNVFDLKSTNLLATCTADDTTIQVADTTAFLPVTHGPNWSDGPNATVFYFKLEREIIRATGKTPTSFTGCSRGQFNTQKAAHTADASAPQERRPRVDEFMYLDLPAVKTALALLTGGIFSTWPANLLGADGDVEVDTNADGVANNWTVFSNDGGRVQTTSLPSGSSPFVGKVQRLAITSVTNSNAGGFYSDRQCRSGITLTCSAYVRTNVGSKVQINCQFYDAAGSFLDAEGSAFVAGDSIAHLAQVTALAPPLTETVRIHVSGINAGGEFLEFDQVMVELGSTVHPYTSNAIQGLLPQHWHMGIAPEFIRFADFTGVGSDLWNLSDDAKGFVTRFEGLAKTDGKAFLEKQIYLLLGAFQPVYSDGSIGLKRLPAMVSSAAPVAVLTEREVVTLSPLQHDYDSLHNQIRVTWAYDIGLGAFTRDTLFIDSQSASIHGRAQPIQYSFRGLHSGTHTENMIRGRLDAIRDAYSYPPQRITVTVLPSLNRFEAADVFRVRVKNVRDFAGSTSDIDRSFVVLRQNIDFSTGELSFELFGSTLRPDAGAPSFEIPAPLPDAFYNSAGVALSTVVSMTGNSVDVGTHNITGNANMNASGAIVYHLGDLVVPNGATINIAHNVQVRVRGFITLNGVINGNFTGLAGVSDPGGAPLTNPIPGNAGFIGHSRGYDGIDMVAATLVKAPTEGMISIPAAVSRGKFDAFPQLNLSVSGNALLGIPDDLRGGGGPPGGRTVLTYSSGSIDAGGTGGAGGAGLAIICRGITFGVSAQITLNGADTTNPAVTDVPSPLLPDIYPGAGGPGMPGACLILLDGNQLFFPNAAGRFSGRTGVVTQAGIQIPQRTFYAAAREFDFDGLNPLRDPWSGYLDESFISDVDMSIAALRIQYVPSTQTPAPDQPRQPAPPLSLTVTPAAGFNTVSVALPELGTFDVVDIYAAITNDRSGAIMVARGRRGDFQHNLPVLATRYYWAQTTMITDTGIELHSAFVPAGATSGVPGTTLNPGGWTPITTVAGVATMIVTASTIEKSGGTSAWDSQAYSAEAYPACFVSFRANDATHNFMIGLNTDPATDADYSSIDFAWYCLSDGTLRIYEGGTPTDPSLSYDPTTVLAITYDGERVQYLRNGSVVRSVVAVSLTLALDSSFYQPGAKALDVKFAPQGRSGADGTDGTDGSDGAPGSPGADGLSVAELAIYLRSASPPSTPTGGSYAFSTQTLTPPGGGWASAVASGNNPVYTCRGVASITGTTGTDSSITWSAPVLVMAEGASVDIVFRRSALQPTTPSPSSSTPASWYSNVNSVPFTEETLWSSVGTRANAGQNWTWQTPIQVEGLDGSSDVAFFGFEEPWEALFQDRANSGSLVATYPANGVYGGKVISAQNQLWIAGLDNISYDPSALYRITTRIRRTAASSAGAGTERVYCGVEGVAANGTTLINEAGSNSFGSQHYNCARGFDMSTVGVNTWKDFVGYFRGLGTSGFGVAPNVDSATPLYTGVTYFRPLVVLNYNAGNGTMECDFIRVEKLAVPDDADNSDKLRVVPDSEFSRDAGANFWLPYTSGGGAVAVATTGGAIDGKATLTVTGVASAAIISRRRPAYQLVPGTFFTITIRWRRTATVGSGIETVVLTVGALRHQQDPESATSFNFAAADVSFGYGTVLLTRSDINNRTVNVWQEDSSIIWLPKDPAFTGNQSLNLSAYAYLSGNTAGASAIEIDYLNCVPGVGSDPFIIRYTDGLGSSTPQAETAFFKKFVHDSSSNFQFNLPEAQAKYIGAKIYFEVRGTGTLTISAATGSDTLRSPPGTSGNRALSGQYARAFAECISATEWMLTGQLA